MFAAFCLALTVSFHGSHLLLIPGPEIPSRIPGILRWKLILGAFASPLLLHLISFYLPASWRRWRNILLLVAYAGSFILLPLTLFTDLLVAGPRYLPTTSTISVTPGPLMPLYMAFTTVVVIASMVTLIVAYHKATSPPLQEHILHLVPPTIMSLGAAFATWAAVLADASTYIFPGFGAAWSLLLAYFYAKAILCYGAFVGRPLSARDFSYTVAGSTVGLVALSLTIQIDEILMDTTALSFFLTTSGLVLLVVIGIVPNKQRIMAAIDARFFKNDRRHQQRLAAALHQALLPIADPYQRRMKLLDMLCEALGVEDGYIAFARPHASSEPLIVEYARGNTGVQTGNRVSPPPVRSKKPLLTAALFPAAQAKPGWQYVTFFCHLPGVGGQNGMVAFCDRKEGKPLSYEDLLLCSQFVQILIRLEQKMQPQPAPEHSPLTKTNSGLQTSTNLTISASQKILFPIAIGVLGPLELLRNGQRVPESDWQTEKAKAMLAYLLWKGVAGATKGELCNAFWPERSVDKAGNVFHVTLHHLRRILEPERRRGSAYILYQGGRYRFNDEAPHMLDATLFESLIREGSLTALREAIALYRGPYLEGIDWALPPEGEIKRRTLEKLYENALRKLAGAAEDEEEAETCLRKLLCVVPADESANRRLVARYLLRGRIDLAQHQLRQWQKELMELDVSPPTHLVRLWQSLEK